MKFELQRTFIGYSPWWTHENGIKLCEDAIKVINPATRFAKELTLIVERESFTNSHEFLIWFDRADLHYHYRTKDEMGYFTGKMNEIICRLLFDSTYQVEERRFYVGISLT